MHDRVVSAPESAASRELGWDHSNEARGSFLLSILDRLLRHKGIGRLTLTLPSGATRRIGASTSDIDARIVLRSYAAFWKLARRGALGFAESYMDGDFDTDDLKAFFEFFMANEAAISKSFPSINDTRGGDRNFHLSRSNTKSGSRRNIADHYDLGNAFYRLWLDRSMLYSSAVYAPGVETLEAAQSEKLRRILAALEISEGHELLEIGCGWGALAEAAARRGARVRAITISDRQLAETRARIAREGLEDRVSATFEDYRDTTGTYDRIVSIEMIEAVGEENWPLFFNTIGQRLRPGGHAVVQAITIREDAFPAYRRNPDFIQRYIFPGGMLPTVELMSRRSGEAGLVFETIERFGRSYARTLADWRLRFEEAWPEIEALGFDERFRRMWRYYLVYCEVGFENGLIDVGLYRLAKPG